MDGARLGRWRGRCEDQPRNLSNLRGKPRPPNVPMQQPATLGYVAGLRAASHAVYNAEARTAPNVFDPAYSSHKTRYAPATRPRVLRIRTPPIPDPTRPPQKDSSRRPPTDASRSFPPMNARTSRKSPCGVRVCQVQRPVVESATASSFAAEYAQPTSKGGGHRSYVLSVTQFLNSMCSDAIALKTHYRQVPRNTGTVRGRLHSPSLHLSATPLSASSHCA